jgi:DNA-binding winged helix-turn-helix (wHTH) protein/Tfp pilus assembly protein PilF
MGALKERQAVFLYENVRWDYSSSLILGNLSGIREKNGYGFPPFATRAGRCLLLDGIQRGLGDKRQHHARGAAERNAVRDNSPGGSVAGRIFQFGEFQIDPEAPLLTHGSRSVALEPKALEVLAVLVKHAGQIVAKDDLMAIVWPDAVVEEGNLAVHVCAIRRALGIGDTPNYIETIPKRGYRFAATVYPVPNPATISTSANEPELLGIAAHYLEQQTIAGSRRAAAIFQRVLRVAPESGAARRGLADALLFRSLLGDVHRDLILPRTKVLLDQAEKIEPGSADVHLSRSRLSSMANWQWAQAEEELHQALECATNETKHSVSSWHGSHLAMRGDADRALDRLKRASLACPLSSSIARRLSEAQYMAGDFKGCVTGSRRALRLHPHLWTLHTILANGLTALGDYDRARLHLRRAALLYDGPKIRLLAERSYLEAIAGRSRLAINLLERVQADPGHRRLLVFIAQTYAVLGIRDRALECLETACAEHAWELVVLKQDCRFDCLRTEMRFRRVLRRVGL